MTRRRFSISAGQFGMTWPSTHETISALVSTDGEIAPPALAGVAGVVAVPSGAEDFLHPAPIRQAAAAIDNSRYEKLMDIRSPDGHHGATQQKTSVEAKANAPTDHRGLQATDNTDNTDSPWVRCPARPLDARIQPCCPCCPWLVSLRSAGVIRGRYQWSGSR